MADSTLLTLFLPIALAILMAGLGLLPAALSSAIGAETQRPFAVVIVGGVLTATLFTLTLVTVLALPINIVAGLFGMNVGGIPLAEHPHGFWVLVGLIAAFTVLAGSWAFGRQRP